MFLIEDRRLGHHNFVFTYTDPRKEGYKGEVIDDVVLDYDMNAIHVWPDGAPRPNPSLGRDPGNPKHYKVFKFPEDLRSAEFELINYNAPIVIYSWLSYLKAFPVPAVLADRLGQAEWFEFLDQIDEATRLVRRKNSEQEPPPGSDRSRIAEWVAKRHMSVDGTIREVWYLPTGAPAGEMRLLEVNDRTARTDAKAEPLDFDVEIAGTPLKLLVADVTKAELERMKHDPTILPDGWTLEGARSWGLPA